MRTEKTIIKMWKSKGNNSSLTDDTWMKLHVHNNSMVIYIQYMVQEIPSTGYKVMAEDRTKIRQSTAL